MLTQRDDLHHIYHPGTPLITAYRVLMQQWRIAFEIGAENQHRGIAPTSVRTLVQLTRDYARTSRCHLGERRIGRGVHPIAESDDQARAVT